jgi:hypothetical protein
LPQRDRAGVAGAQSSLGTQGYGYPPGQLSSRAYATGGAINFRLWRGGQINGAIYGVEGGSFGYLNNYALIGKQTGNFEGSLFASDVRGYISHSSFNTQTLNSLMTYAPTPNDRVTLKVIENALTTNLSIRLSLNQFAANPLQRGCTVASTATALKFLKFHCGNIPKNPGFTAFGIHQNQPRP